MVGLESHLSKLLVGPTTSLGGLGCENSYQNASQDAIWQDTFVDGFYDLKKTLQDLFNLFSPNISGT